MLFVSAGTSKDARLQKPEDAPNSALILMLCYLLPCHRLCLPKNSVSSQGDLLPALAILKFIITLKKSKKPPVFALGDLRWGRDAESRCLWSR